MRTFDSGATRDTSDGKLDFHEYLSPAVLRRYAQYMLTKQGQPDGKKRPGNNWKKGIPTDVYMASLTRHFMDVWLFHEGRFVPDSVEEEGMTLEIALSALLFNVMGYLDNLLVEKQEELDRPAPGCRIDFRDGPQWVMPQEFVTAEGYESVGVSTPVEFVSIIPREHPDVNADGSYRGWTKAQLRDWRITFGMSDDDFPVTKPPVGLYEAPHASDDDLMELLYKELDGLGTGYYLPALETARVRNLRDLLKNRIERDRPQYKFSNNEFSEQENLDSRDTR